jgi:uncharacterized secreted protein with C-terminal beta-propeller domain
MSKKDYIDAMNEIEPRESLKKETFSKITKPIRKHKRIYPILSVAAMVIIAIGIGVPLYNKDINNLRSIELGEKESTDTNETEEIGLPRVENFENLYAMISKMEVNNYYIEDSITDATTVSPSIKNEANSTQESNAERKEYSETNTQVKGVDEADIVKTDGRYIYYLSNKKLTITSVDGSNLERTSSIEFNDEHYRPMELFVRENKLILIGTKHEEGEIKPLRKSKILIERDNYYPTYNTYTVIKVYDIKNRENPELSRTVEVEGYYISSRMVGNNIYLIANKSINSYLCKNYEIDKLNEDAFKVQYLDTAVNQEKRCIAFADICYIPESESPNYLNVVSFNVNENKEANIDSYLGAGEKIYSSEKNLYVTKSKFNYEDKTDTSKRATEIYKFNLIDGKCKFQKSGEVPGTIINQFSMDESEEYFRIATTDNSSWEQENNTNNLYVLNNELEIVGKVEGLAKGEKIYSVRFMGNRAYMVTFVETDPLFVIDLSIPTEPKVLGELKIPGYSKYLHPYDETHLIGFGENTEVVNYGYGDRVVTNGMKMALFDVTDPNNPQEMYSVDIGEKGTSSELLYNHKALLFSKEKDIIAFPISRTIDNYKVDFRGAIVYGLNLEKGFTLKGEISHNKNDYELYHSNNKIERIIYIGDNLFTLSENKIKATDMNSMKELSHIDL